MNHYIEVVTLILLSTVKFLLIPPLAIMQYKMHFAEAFTINAVGGIIGVLVFYFLSTELIIAWNWVLTFPPVRRIKQRLSYRTHISTKRRIVRIKTRWGLLGVIIITPCILSIPLGTFLVVRFFPGWKSIVYLSLSCVAWSFILNFSTCYMMNAF